MLVLSRPLCVLVVDDNRDGADSLVLMLRQGGFESRAAYDGLSALRLAVASRPHAVLLDISLPGLDGYEVARRLRQEGGLGDALLVALTGWDSEEDRLRSAEAGFDLHLSKPLDWGRLRPLLADLAARQQAEHGLEAGMGSGSGLRSASTG
jgi:CheY-like chemotaxis protein